MSWTSDCSPQNLMQVIWGLLGALISANIQFRNNFMKYVPEIDTLAALKKKNIACRTIYVQLREALTSNSHTKCSALSHVHFTFI